MPDVELPVEITRAAPILQILLVLFSVRWGFELADTRDKPADWQPSRSRTWPLRLDRNGFRLYLVVFIAVQALLFAWTFTW